MMPVIGFGTWEVRESKPIFDAIKFAGYRHIDTASFYKNEEIVGEAIKQAIDEGVVKREDLWVTTKIWPEEFGDVDGAIQSSLKKLQLDYVDQYLIHWPRGFWTENKTPMHVLWPRMEAVNEKGLAKSIGISNVNVQLLGDLLCYCKIKPATN